MPRAKKPLNVVADHSKTEEKQEPIFDESGKEVIDTKRPVCTRRNILRFLSKSEGKLIFQMVGKGAVVVTDVYGFEGDKRRVYNGTPSDFLVTPRANYLPGESVFMVRSMTRGRKVLSGRVVEVLDNRNVVIEPYAVDPTMIGSRRKHGETGYLVFPPAMVFKRPEDISDLANSILADLEVAKTQQRASLENPKNSKLVIS